VLIRMVKYRRARTKPWARERHRSDLRVVHEIADQKEGRRSRTAANHEPPVLLDCGAREYECRRSESRMPEEGIQARVDRWERSWNGHYSNFQLSTFSYSLSPISIIQRAAADR